MGIVHLAESPQHEYVALKVLRPHIVGDDEARQRLAREVSTLSRVTSDRVAAIIDADPWGELPYVVTEYVDGPSLRDHVRDHGAMGEREVRRFGAGLAEALAAVHRVGVLHRDIKPGNVLVEDGEAVLIDFGLARLDEDPRMTATGWLLGTPGYLAPEILYGEEATAASDVHSLAATLAFAALGRPPAGTGPPMAIMDRVRRGEFDLRGVPDGLLPLIEDCLSPEPLRRPTVLEVLRALGGQQPSAPAPEPTVMLERTRVLPPTLPPTLPPVPTHAPPPDPGSLDRAYDQTTAPAARPYRDAYPDAYAAPYDPFAAPAEAPSPYRARQRAGLVGLLAAAFGLTAWAPYVGLAVTAVLATVLRFASVTSQRHSRRRNLRGRARWYDVPASTVASPLYLVVSLAGTLVLLGSAALVVACAAFVLGASPASSALALVILAALWTATLWWGPGSQRVRERARRATRILATPSGLGPIVLIAGIGIAVILLLVLAAAGAWWAPAGSAPWSSGWMASLGRWLR